MIQDNKNEKHFIADSGKVFQRVFNGFSTITVPYIVGSEIFLGEIIADAEGNMLSTPIEDKIDYYEEVDAPKPESTKRNK